MDYDRQTLMSQIHEVLVTVAFPSPRREQGEGFVLSILFFFHMRMTGGSQVTFIPAQRTSQKIWISLRGNRFSVH